MPKNNINGGTFKTISDVNRPPWSRNHDFVDVVNERASLMCTVCARYLKVPTPKQSLAFFFMATQKPTKL